MKYIKLLSILWMGWYMVGCGTSSSIESDDVNQENSINEKLTRIACVGDSITEGYGLSNSKNDSYPSKLQVLLGKSYKVKNFGISNKTLMKNGDDPYWNHAHYRNSLAYKPDVVIIMLGTNDLKEQNWNKKNNFVKDYSDLIKKYKELDSQAIIYICKPPPSYGELAGITNIKIKDMVGKVEEVASNNNFVKVIDVYAKMSNHREWFSEDALHPNKLGANNLAKIIYETVYP